MVDLQIIFSVSNDKLLQNARAVDGVCCVHQSVLSTCIAHLKGQKFSKTHFKPFELFTNRGSVPSDEPGYIKVGDMTS